MLKRVLCLMVLLSGVASTMQKVTDEDLREAVRTGNAREAFKYMLNVDMFEVDLMNVKLMQDLIGLKDFLGMTALHWAVIYKRADVVASLVANGADSGVPNNEGKTPLDQARLIKNSVSIELLEAQQKMRNLARAVARQDADEAFKYLGEIDLTDFKQIDAFAQLKNFDGRIPLHIAAAFGLYDVAWHLLDHSNKEERDSSGKTPLHVAVENGQYLIARLLIEHGADKNAQDNKGETPLHKAAALGKVDMAQLLLESGVDKEPCDFSGNNPLHTAVFHEKDAVVQLLLDSGVDVNAKANFGYSALHIATEYSFVKMITLLLRRGANREIVDDIGRTPYKIAEEHGQYSIMNLLRASVEQLQRAAQRLAWPVFFKKPSVNYHGLIILINDGSSVTENIDCLADVTCSSLAIAIAQKAVPIIVAAPILRDFLWRRNEIMKNSSEQKRLLFDCVEQREKSKADEIVRLYGDEYKCYAHEQAYLFSQIPFDRDWRVFSSSDQTFYLLVPQNSVHDIKNEMNLGSPVDIQTLVAVPKRNIESNIDINIASFTSFLRPGSGVWNIYLLGHGITDVAVGGLLLEQFEQLLSFLSTRVHTSFLYYMTCYGGGINLVTSYLKQSALPFVVSLQATTEGTVYGSRFTTGVITSFMPMERYVLCSDQDICPRVLRQVKVSVDFVNFFKGLRELFVPVKGRMPPTLFGDPWRHVLSFVSPLDDFEASDTPLIRFVGSDFFQASELGQSVMTLTEMRKRGAEYVALRKRVGDYGAANIIVANKKALLVYPHTIETTLEITEAMPAIVSMNPEAAAHFFTRVEALEFGLSSVLTGFLGNVQELPAAAPVKIFVIKTIKCLKAPTIIPKEFSDVVIAPTAKGRVWFKCDGKCFTGIRSSNDSSWEFLPITPRRYCVNVAALLERYAYTPVKMRREGKLVAPWQIEPRKQAKKIAKRLGVNVFGVSQIVDAVSAVD